MTKRRSGQRGKVKRKGKPLPVSVPLVQLDVLDIGTGPGQPESVEADIDFGSGVAFTDPEDVGISKHWYPVKRAGVAWDCPYGCPGRVYAVDGLEAHVWNCPWWENEGKQETPFDLPGTIQLNLLEESKHAESKAEKGTRGTPANGTPDKGIGAEVGDL